MSNDILQFTDSAIEKISEHAARRAGGNLSANLRFGVQGGGCSGLQYLIKFDEVREDDFVEELSSGVKILVDPKSAILLTGSTVDYHDSLTQSGFEIRNPQARNGCGCGKSFGAS